MPQLYIKICGLSTPESVAAAVAAGADAVGFVFAPGSPRTVDAELAASLGQAVPADVETVGVFRNQPLAEVMDIATSAAVSTVQLHGDEPLADIRALRDAGFKTLRAFSVDAFEALPEAERLLWDAERILIDAVEPGAGVTFDATNVLAEPPAGMWLLAGGLNPGNVAGLVKTLNPSGVDVSSGVESSRGVKDNGLIADFIRAARSAE
ncbi:phosphoribosylanthranilate isomerase [Paeniglutamicibacter kerguelensis]|uniref:N-(5'-phosphoribosyl)anthranilate isomerase n=1 Tax=Paeniglutamicibacter kerguelensis TaxID=254788 RepID=A0ABS4XGT7_9MICC|nr:phosphoribosylanthranilate isomerase [Paeniglutamicibacter kerguelensis]MBP2387682.1 phosphoribosylanthranilate isomerase [Paeniglutamicibacter kerguelensis]